jgi:hypothetical protein
MSGEHRQLPLGRVAGPNRLASRRAASPRMSYLALSATKELGQVLQYGTLLNQVNSAEIKEHQYLRSRLIYPCKPAYISFYPLIDLNESNPRRAGRRRHTRLKILEMGSAAQSFPRLVGLHGIHRLPCIYPSSGI